MEHLQRRRLKCLACEHLNTNSATRCEHCGSHIPDEVHHAQFIDDDSSIKPSDLLIWAVALGLIYLFFTKL